MSETRSGVCLCGAARFTAVVSEERMDACHCGMCRRWSGGPFMCVQVAGLQFDHPEAVSAYRSSGWGERVFCRTCGTHMAWRMQDGTFAAASAFVFEEPLPYALQTEIFIDEKPDTYAFAGDTQRLTGAEVQAMFEGNNG